MSNIPIRTTVIGSYPFPGWLEFASQHLDKFGAADIEEASDSSSNVQLLFDGKFNPMVAMMVKKPLQKFIDTLIANIGEQ